jgi:hypothetical protein
MFWYIIVRTFLKVLLTTFVLSNSANFDLNPESEIDVAVEKAKLRNTEQLSLTTTVDCTATGVFAINCTSYKVCVYVGWRFIGVEATCLLEWNFNPVTLLCDPGYDCTQCTREGFICLTNTSFTLCSDALEVVVRNVTCPHNHCSHEAYILSCHH